MNNPYVVKLDQLLQEIPQAERQEILQDYLEHFRLAQAEGKTQEEIADALGSVEALAADILAEYRADGASPAEAVTQSKPVFRWRSLAVPAISAVLFVGLIAALVAVKVVPSNSTPVPEASHAAALSPAPAAASSSTSSSGPTPPPAAAKKPGGLVAIKAEQNAPGEVRTLRIETVDTDVIIDTAKDSFTQTSLEGKITVKENEDWTDYYEYGAETSGGTFHVFVRPTEAKKLQMPQGRSTTLRIYLPEALLEELDVATVSGMVKGPALKAASFNGASVSGNIELLGINGKSHHLNNVSGNIKVGSLSGDFSVESISGKVQITGASWDNSGSVNTVSGNVNLTAAEKLPFA